MKIKKTGFWVFALAGIILISIFFLDPKKIIFFW